MSNTDLTHESKTVPVAVKRFGTLGTGVVLIVLGAFWLLDATDVIEVKAAVILPLLLAVVGVLLLLGSTSGPHSGLVTLGVFLTIATLFAAVTPPEAFRGGVGERNHVIANVDELAERYELGMGEMTLDLENVELRGDHRVRISVGLGSLVVLVPDGTALTVEANVGAGDLSVLGEKTDGLGLSRTYTSPDYDDADNRLELDLEIGAGNIEVK